MAETKAGNLERKGRTDETEERSKGLCDDARERLLKKVELGWEQCNQKKFTKCL